MEIPKNQLVGRLKKIGKLGKMDVMEGATKGGFHIVTAVKENGKSQTLGTGPHPAIARHIAMTEFPGLRIDTLAKHESLPKWMIERDAPAYASLAARMRKLEE